MRSAIDISILPSKHSIVGPLSFSGLLNSFVTNLAMELVFAFSMSSSNFSIILELMKHVDTEFVFFYALDFSGSCLKQSTRFLAMEL